MVRALVRESRALWRLNFGSLTSIPNSSALASVSSAVWMPFLRCCRSIWMVSAVFGAGDRGPVLLLARLVAADAEGAVLHAQKIVRGLMNLVIAVAGGATGQSFGFELVPHLGVLEQCGDLAVASAAGVDDGAELRRSGAVIAVAVVARRRTEVALVQQGLAVDALPPLGIFVAGKRLSLIRVARHVSWVGMALRTGLGHVQYGRRARWARSPDECRAASDRRHCRAA